MKSVSKRNILIGLTVIVSIFLLYWGIEYLKGVNLFKPSNYYYASFEKVDGLKVSAEIKVNGFQVGQVRDIEYDYEHNMITVEMSFEKEMRIPKGSTVTLDASLLGSASLVLTLGKEKTYYNVGDRIPTATEVGLMDNVEAQVMPAIASILPKVDSIMGNVNTILSNPALHQSVDRLDIITEELAKSSQELTALMNSLNNSIPGVMKNVDGTMGNANALSNDLKTTTSNLNQLTTSLKNMPLDTTINRINSTLANLQQLTAQLNNEKSSLGMLMHDEKLYKNAANTIASLDSLLVDLKKNPKKYVTIKVF